MNTLEQETAKTLRTQINALLTLLGTTVTTYAYYDDVAVIMTGEKTDTTFSGDFFYNMANKFVESVTEQNEPKPKSVGYFVVGSYPTCKCGVKMKSNGRLKTSMPAQKGYICPKCGAEKWEREKDYLE